MRSGYRKLDLNKGFYQVPLSRGSQDKTAFCTPWGKYAFTRMPFGLKNAPAAFQRCMQNTLAHLSVYSSAYIDDILIYSKNWEDHLDHIEAVLLALREAGLTANPDKCVWGAKSLEYLGHKIGYGMVGVPEARVKALKDYIKPTNQKGLRAFLGTAGYYRKFIPEFSQWAGPLFNALKKGAPCSLAWDKHMCASFKHLISILCHEHTLTLPRNNDKLELHTDASTMGIGAVLSVIREDMEKTCGLLFERIISCREKLHSFRVGMPSSCQGY